MTSTLHDDARRVLAGYASPAPEQRALREAFLALLDARSDAVWRSCEPGHLTASAMVVDPSRRAVLLTLHPRVGRWLQLGGHLEPGDDSVAAAALREATEESGIDGLRLDPVPVDLDVHPITCSSGVPTRHLDVRYLAVAPAGAVEVCSDESDALAWFDWDNLPDEVAVDTPRLLRRAMARLDMRPDINADRATQ
ncbi:MAG TPA: NUDIX hydrolase [Mycobacteriales bacterium]|jgi:NTP pyrophosphohydrolases including oxidative damage repair enzymes